MPNDLQAFIWILGCAIIVLCFGIIGYLVKSKLDDVIKKMDAIHNSVVELFREDKKKVEEIAILKGEIRAIKDLCCERHKEG